MLVATPMAAQAKPPLPAAPAAGAPAPVAAASQRVQAAIDAIQADDSYQLELPELQTPPQMGTPAWLRAFSEWLDGPGRIVANVLLAIAIIVVIGYVLYLTVPAVRDAIDGLIARVRRRADEDEGDADPWRPDAAAARSLLDEADALAKAGAYGEAVHLVLRHSLTDINRRRPDMLKPALTARAIARAEALPDIARSAFGTVVGLVERSRWAGQALQVQDWETARAAYTDFAFGNHWRASAT